MPQRQRFTRPAKLALAPACRLCVQLGMFNSEKRGFNPPLANWLRGPLRERLSGLPGRLQSATNGQIPSERAQALLRGFNDWAKATAEQVLQLLMLETALRQLHP
jgi:hypothetical protein